MELASLKKARKIASHRGHGVGVLLIFDPSVEYLSNLSECTVTRPEDAKFAPKRTNQEKQLFIKSMLSKYANGQSFTSSTHDDKKLTMEDGWCGVLHEFINQWHTYTRQRQRDVPFYSFFDSLRGEHIGIEALVRFKLNLYITLDDTRDNSNAQNCFSWFSHGWFAVVSQWVVWCV